MMAVLPSFFLRKWLRILLSLLFLFFLFGYRTFISAQLLPYGVSLTLASCVSLKVRYEEIVKAMGKSIRQEGVLSKDDFIYNVEKWLVRNDVFDEEYMRSPSQIKKTNVASYVESVEQTLKWKASDLLDDFYKMVKESHVRGTSEFVKNKCRRV